MKPAIVMQSDFGIDSGLVACMHGICKMIDPQLETYDITHQIPAFQIREASYCLQYTVPCWPSGTVFVSVVDPGGGTSRRASVAKLKNGSYVVTPDNGTLTFLHDMIGVEKIREIDEKTNRYQKTKNVSVFHGRDLFAYCAAKLAAGKITYEEVGPEYPVEEIILHELHHAEVTTGDVKAMIQGYDPFGSAEVSVRNEEFVQAGFQLGERLRVSVSDAKRVILDKEILYERSFGYVPKGEDVLFQDLASFVTIASNEANFKKKYGLCEEQQYKVRIRRTNK